MIRESAVRVTRRRVRSGAREVAVRIARPAGDVAPTGSALLIHGWGSAQDEHDARVADTLAAVGVRSLTLDLPGHGRSPGVAEAISRADFLAAVLTAHDTLLAEPDVDPAAVTVVGSSFGAYLAIRLLGHRDVRNLVLRVPGNYPDEPGDAVHQGDLFGPHAMAWRRLPLLPGATAAMRALQHFDGEVLIVEAENDEAVPRQTLLNLADSLTPEQLTYAVITGAPHVLYSDPVRGPIADAVIFSWLCARHGLVQPRGTA